MPYSASILRGLVSCLTLSTLLEGSPTLHRRDTLTTTVDLSNSTGTPQHLASGTLYGLPNQVDQIPDKFFQEIGWNYERAGGAQIPAPGRGWIWGVKEYKNRFTTVLHNYRTTRNHGGNFIFLIHDLYGADGSQNSSTPYPGDNESWIYWDDYLDHVVKDMRQNNMLENMIIDIWNEPDLIINGVPIFWGRSQDQYLQMWGRTFARFRAEFGTSVLLSGPASAGEPLVDYTWWVNWAAFVAANNSMPDQIAWHMEGGGGDLLSAHDGLVRILNNYSLPMKPINVNEYGTFPEQVPAGSAWWISQLERIDAHGLRGNWLSGLALHDYLASLLTKPHANTPSYTPRMKGYSPNGDYQVYKYYATNMTGHRVGTTPSTDTKVDTYSTIGTDGVVRVLTGVRITEGTWYVTIKNLQAVGLPSAGTLNIHTWGFPAAIDPHYGEVDGPNDLGTYGHAYSDGSVTFPVFQTDVTTAYSFEFAVGNRTVV